MNQTLRSVASYAMVVGGLWWWVRCVPTWDPATFVPDFHLIGEHETAACTSCHPADQPLGPLPTACASCHEGDRPPGHYDGDCGQCHTPFGWLDIVHDFFPLEDAHALPCTDCHTTGTFEALDPTCSACHEEDRKDPNHYPGQDCGGCHVPTTWGDATFDHTFPQGHRNANACADCHPNNDYADLSCTGAGCHSAADLTDRHREVGAFSLDDHHTCLNCHPRGLGD